MNDALSSGGTRDWTVIVGHDVLWRDSDAEVDAQIGGGHRSRPKDEYIQAHEAEARSPWVSPAVWVPR